MTLPKIDLDRPTLPEQADTAYFVVATMRVQVDGDPPASGLYIPGSVEGGAFRPSGDIEGEGPIGAGEGAPGWVELADQSWHGAQTGRAPFKPYLEGNLTNDGVLTPSSRRVHR